MTPQELAKKSRPLTEGIGRGTRKACGRCLGSGTEARTYDKDHWAIPTCRQCNGRGYIKEDPR